MRSRSRQRVRGSVVLQHFKKVRGERRGDKVWRRRFKAAALRLLEFLVISFDAPIAVCDPRSTSRTAAVRRRGEISNRARDIRYNWYIQTRAEPLLPGIEEDDLDSVAADSVDVSSSDFEEKRTR